MESFIPKVHTWAEERNIINGSNLDKETLKLVSKCGKLINFLDNGEVCTNAIGYCLIQMIIICRMQNITFDACLKFTKAIKDERVADPKIAALLVFKNIGQLAENVSTRKDIKADIGYLLIYLTALTTSLQLSMKECVESSFNEIKDSKEIMFDGVMIDEAHEKYPIALTILKSKK